MVRLAEEQYDKADDASEEAAQMYRQAAEELKRDIAIWYARLAANNDVSFAEAMKLLDADELEEFHWTVEQYIKAGEENAVDQKWMKELENASAKVHIRRLEAIELQCEQQAQLAAAKEKKQIADLLQLIFLSTYYGMGYEASRAKGFLVDFAVMPSDEVNSIIYTPWAKDGKDFSERIWADRDKLTVELRKIIEQGLMTGKSVDEMSKQVQDAMGSTASNAERIIQTETAAVIEKSHEKMYQEFGAENVVILATLDMKTCATCGSLDHKVIPMKSYEMGVTIPPFHPRCRCTTMFDDVLVFDDDTRTARDENGNSYEVPMDMSYDEWKRKLRNKANTNKTSSGIKANKNNAESTEKSTYSGKIKVTEKDVPKQSSKSLRKGIAELQKKIDWHKRKIENPEKEVADWNDYDERHKQGLIRHWKKEIVNFQESIKRRETELKKRGDTR